MTNIDLEKLANERNEPCVSISLNTHRSIPQNAEDLVVLKTLINEAQNRLISEFEKQQIGPLLEHLSAIPDKVDLNNSRRSLHIFLSNDTSEIVKTSWPVSENRVHISETFNIRPLIKELVRTESYLIMLLSQAEVHLYQAQNDQIIDEIKNNYFPFVGHHFNNVDEALLQVYRDTGLKCVVIGTEENYSRLIGVANKPEIYYGNITVNYNQIEPHQLAEQAWEFMRSVQKQRDTAALNEMQEAVGTGNVYTDLQDIFQAAIDGRGDLLILNYYFNQPVCMTSERTFEITDDARAEGVIDDISSNIAWQVFSKNGRVVFTDQEALADFGNIALKTRY